MKGIKKFDLENTNKSEFWFELGELYSGERYALNYNSVFKGVEESIDYFKSNKLMSSYLKIIEVFTTLIKLKLINLNEIEKKGILEFGVGTGYTGHFYKMFSKKYLGLELHENSTNFNYFPKENLFIGDGLNYINNSTEKFKFIISFLFGGASLMPELYEQFFQNIEKVMNKDSLIILESDGGTIEHLLKKTFKTNNFQNKFQLIKMLYTSHTNPVLLIGLK